MIMENKITVYKGFDKDLKCRDFQYEVGKSYEEEKAIQCESGFHACECPLDVFDYYPPANSRYCEVMQSGEISKGDDKTASTKIEIGAEIGIAGLVKAHVNWVKSQITHSEKAGYRGSSVAGDMGSSVAGYMGSSVAGYMGSSVAGDMGSSVAGDMGNSISRGSAKVGANGVAIARGSYNYNLKVCGGIGSLLIVIVEYEDSLDIKMQNTAIVDGENVKADTWYTLNLDGEWVVCDEN